MAKQSKTRTTPPTVPKAETPEQQSSGDDTSLSIEFIDDMHVRAKYRIKKSRHGMRYTKNSVFDFSGLSQREIVGLAMYGVKVGLQRQLRNMSEADIANPDTFATVNVKNDIVNAQRKPADPMTQFLRSATRTLGVTEDEAREALEFLAKLREAKAA